MFETTIIPNMGAIWTKFFLADQNTLYANIPLRLRSLHAVIAQPDERLANRTQESALCCCGSTDAECLVLTDENVG